MKRGDTDTASTTHGTYVYCLVEAARQPVAARLPRGLPGAGRPRVLRLGPRRWLVVADVPLPQYDEQAISRGLADVGWVSRMAVAHERVVESVIASAAVVPMKLLTIFRNDSRANAHFMASAAELDDVIARVRGHVEWSVRISRPSPAETSTRAPETPARSGAAYLQRKKQLRDEASSRLQEGRTLVGEVFDRLAEKSSRALRRTASQLPASAGVLLLDAAFLVPRTRQRAFGTMAERQTRPLSRRGFGVTVSGPWPPYSFIQESA